MAGSSEPRTRIRAAWLFCVERLLVFVGHQRFGRHRPLVDGLAVGLLLVLLKRIHQLLLLLHQVRVVQHVRDFVFQLLRVRVQHQPVLVALLNVGFGLINGHVSVGLPLKNDHGGDDVRLHQVAGHIGKVLEALGRVVVVVQRPHPVLVAGHLRPHEHKVVRARKTHDAVEFVNYFYVLVRRVNLRQE